MRFQAYSSSRHKSRAGDIVAWREGDFHPLPPLETIVRTAEPSHRRGRTVPVRLVACMNALGLLQISCISLDPASQLSWPLELTYGRMSKAARAPVRDGIGTLLSKLSPTLRRRRSNRLASRSRLCSPASLAPKRTKPRSGRLSKAWSGCSVCPRAHGTRRCCVPFGARS